MPSLPFRNAAEEPESSTSEPTFGKELLKDFPFEPGWLNLNHGSFGTVPTSIISALRAIQTRTENAPDRFIRYEYPHILDESRSAMAKLLGVPTSTIVFVPNATTAINTVLRNLVYEKGDVIVYFAPGIYGACERTIEYMCEITPVQGHPVNLEWPCSHAQILKSFEEAIVAVRAEGKNPKLAMFDTVVSMPGVRMPFEDLIAICKREKVLSLVDGAHGIGMLDPKTDLRLTETDPDFWTSNAHKWLFVPRGCAALYVPLRNQSLMRSTLPTSHGFMPLGNAGEKIVNPLPAKKKKKIQVTKMVGVDGEDEVETEANSTFVTGFEFVGTVDNAPYLCVRDAIKYREEKFGGEAKVVAYLKKLAKRAGEIFSEALGTEVLENAEGTLSNCAFANVRLPLDSVAVAEEAKVEANGVGSIIRDWLCEKLIQDYQTFMQFMFYKGSWYVRLSAAAYLEEEDFQKGAKILLELCDRIKQGGWAVED